MSKGLVLTVILIIFFGLFYWAKNTPQYATWQMISAYQKHDSKLLEKYIDAESVSAQLTDDIIKTATEKTTAANDSQASGLERFGRAFGLGIIISHRNEIQARIKTAVLDMAGGSHSQDSSLPDINALNWRDVLPGGRISFTNDDHDVLIHLPNRQQQVIILRLHKKSGVWQIVKLENARDLFQNIF